MRSPQQMVVALLFLAGADGARARTTSDWNEVAAQLALMPDQCRTGPTFGTTDGPIEEAATALGRGLAPAAGAPKTWKIVRLDDPHIDSFTRDTIIFETNDGGTVVSYHFYDALGVLRSPLDKWPSGCAELVAASVAPAGGRGEIAGPVHVQTRRFDVMHYLDNRGSHPDKVIVHIDDAAIDLSPSPNHGLHVSGVYQAPESWTRKAYPHLVFYRRHDKGTHFAAWEQPQELAEDLRDTFRGVRGA